jgi:hypothetical protein
MVLGSRVGGLVEGGVEVVFSLGGSRSALGVRSRVWTKGGGGGGL